MSRRRIFIGVSVAAALVLAAVPGCKDSGAPGAAGDDERIESATADHTDIPYYYGLIEEYRADLAEDPNSLAANIALANALYEAGQWREAIPYYDEALRINPENADVVTDRGSCYRRMGMTDEAIREYHRALKIDPSNQDALYNLGIVYSHDKKDLAKAILFWERLLQVAPKHPRANDIHASIRGFRRVLKAGGQ